MLRISFVNMPFAALGAPSLGLTQLSSVLQTTCRDSVSTGIFYLNQDFGHYIGVEIYGQIASGDLGHHSSGIGDWFFRQVAFPELADNAKEYFQRYYPHRDDKTQAFKQLILEKREGLQTYLDELIDKYRLDEADIVGLTSMFNQNIACFALARRLKERNPNITVTIGGANCEAPMGIEIIRNVEFIDFVFSGPALKSFPTFVQYYLNREKRKCHSIRGVFSKTNILFPQVSAADAIGEELDLNVQLQLDYEPFLNILEKNFPQKEVVPTLFFETSRGCWWGERSHCTFCGLNSQSMHYRAMSPQRALDLFEALFAYSSRCSHFFCVDNILPKSYLKEVLPFLKTPSTASIFYEVKADLNEEELQVLAHARVQTIQPGIESLATSTLKLMRKGTSAFQNLRFLKSCLIQGIWPAWNLLVGFPGEGEEVYKKYVRDIPLLMHLPPPSGVFPVRFDRYSPYFVQEKEYQLDLHPLDYYYYSYPFSETSLRNFAYYFADHRLGSYFMAMVKWIDYVREKFAVWSACWNNNDELPQLFLRETKDGPLVYDSRTDKPVEHILTPTGYDLLKRLTHPKRLVDLSAELSAERISDPDKELAFLQERGLVFQEGERIMSLVLPRAPSTVTSG